VRRLPAVLVLLALVAGCSAGEEPEEPVRAGELDGVVSVEGLSNQHVEGSVTYDQDPPVGGPHNPRWLACDVYDEPVPNELAVHSLEHGGVWLAHDPELPAEQREQLEALADLDEEYVLVSPYDGLPSPVVASAWGLQLQVEDAEDPRLREFVDAYAGGDQGGEPGVPCREGGLGLEEARQAVGG
jgi:hypothetical protein